jgi:hypothetical protein
MKLRRRNNEILANLEPSTELDSQVRDFFTRMIRKASEQGKQVVLDMDEGNPGFVHWEMFKNGERNLVNIWWTPE